MRLAAWRRNLYIHFAMIADAACKAIFPLRLLCISYNNFQSHLSLFDQLECSGNGDDFRTGEEIIEGIFIDRF